MAVNNLSNSLRAPSDFLVGVLSNSHLQVVFLEAKLNNSLSKTLEDFLVVSRINSSNLVLHLEAVVSSEDNRVRLNLALEGSSVVSSSSLSSRPQPPREVVSLVGSNNQQAAAVSLEPNQHNLAPEAEDCSEAWVHSNRLNRAMQGHYLEARTAKLNSQVPVVASLEQSLKLLQVVACSEVDLVRAFQVAEEAFLVAVKVHNPSLLEVVSLELLLKPSQLVVEDFSEVNNNNLQPEAVSLVVEQTSSKPLVEDYLGVHNNSPQLEEVVSSDQHLLQVQLKLEANSDSNNNQLCLGVISPNNRCNNQANSRCQWEAFHTTLTSNRATKTHTVSRVASLTKKIPLLGLKKRFRE